MVAEVSIAKMFRVHNLLPDVHAFTADLHHTDVGERSFVGTAKAVWWVVSYAELP